MKKTLISAILVIALCLSVIAGSTFALFTAESGVNVAITSAKVAVKATIVKESLATTSLGVAQTAGEFKNGGTATFDAKDDLVLTNVTPGDKATFTIQVENTSTVDIQYRVKWAVNGELYEALVATADGAKIVNNTSDWALWTTADASTKTIAVSVELPYTVGNEYQDKSASVSFMVEAVQGNAIVENVRSAEELALALQMGNTAKLASDVTLTESQKITIADDTVAVIDLNGFTLSGSSAEDAGALIVNNGTLSIIGSNDAKITNTTANGDAVVENFGELVIEDVTIVGAPIADGSYPQYAVYSKGGSVTINEGTTIISDRGALRVKDSEAVINGGTFAVTDAANSRTLTCHTIYAQSGSTLTINDGTFENHYTGVSGASVVCPAGGSITINGGDFRDDVDSTADFNNTANIQNYMGYGVPVNVYGGTFDDNTVNTNVAAGYTTVYDGANGIYIVTTAGNKGMTNSKGETIIVPEEVTKIIEATAGTDVTTEITNAIKAGESVYIDAPGTYDMPGVSGKEMTIAGTKDVIIDIGGGYGQTTSINGSDITFEGVTVKGSTDNYQGLSDAGTVTYNNVTLNAGTFLYGEKTVFNNCTFNLTTQYLWTYAVNEVEFNNCVFNTEGKAILVYNEGDGGSTVTVKDCTFNASKAAYTWDNQYVAAVEINSSLINAPEKFVVNFEGTNTVNFTGTEADAKGNCGFNGLWRVKNETFNANKQNLIVVDGLTIVADGLYTDAQGNFYVANGNGLAALNAYLTADMWATDKLCNKTIHIMNDIDASGVVWNTVNAHTGSHSQNGFTFDGQGYTISGLAINGSGLFNTRASNGTTSTPTTFKDITFDDVTVNGDFHTGVVWGHAYGNLVLNNVHVTNSNVTGLCNVGALVGRNGSDGAYSTIKFINCSVTDTTVTSTGGGDNAGASAFLGAALGGAGWIDLTFEGNNVATGNTLETADGQQGGGIYAITVWGEPSWDIPEVVTNYNNYKNY